MQTVENRNTVDLYTIVYRIYRFLHYKVLGLKTIFVHVEMTYLMVVYDIFYFSQHLLYTYLQPTHLTR